MIVIGYQGVGKSTLAAKNLRCIDLESSSFKGKDGVRPPDWYETYCSMAEDLSRQGYIVFTSSHEVVRNRLKDSTEEVFVCYPAAELKDAWIRRLEKRFLQTLLNKDYVALANADACYEANIREIEQSGFRALVIDDPTLSLEDLLPRVVEDLEQTRFYKKTGEENLK